jgi:hypothetical protein
MTRVLLIAVALLAAGCGNAFTMNAPQNFVVLDEDSAYAERMTSADRVVIGVHEIDNEEEGSLQFWTDAIRNKLRVLGGYALLSETEVRARSGERGKQMRFGRDEGSVPYLYWVTVFVTDDYIFVIEAGARREVFERAQAQVERAIQRFEID